MSHTRRPIKGKKGKPGRWVFIPEDEESPQGPYDRGAFGAAPAPVAGAEEGNDIIIISDDDEPQEEVGHDKNDRDEPQEAGENDAIDVWVRLMSLPQDVITKGFIYHPHT